MITEKELYYLRSIRNQMRSIKEALSIEIAFSMGTMAFEDNINWLDCFIDEHERKLATVNGR